MKGWRRGILILLLAFLALTPSLYVEWIEINAIMIAAVLIPFFSLGLKRRLQLSGEIKCAMAGIQAFILYWIFSLLDLVIDHFMYDQPTGQEDGRALTVSEKIREYNDDLMYLSWIPLVVAMLLIWGWHKWQQSKSRAM